MDEQEHIKAAEQWERVANDNSGKNFVLPQAYFYSVINYVEAVLARRNLHPRDHEERHTMLRDANGFDAIDREHHERLLSSRREAGYRGRNGDKLRKIKQAHQHFKEKWEKTKI